MDEKGNKALCDDGWRSKSYVLVLQACENPIDGANSWMKTHWIKLSSGHLGGSLLIYVKDAKGGMCCCKLTWDIRAIRVATIS